MDARLISSGESIPPEFFDFERNINSKGPISISLNRKSSFFSSSISGAKNSFAIISEDKNQLKAIASLNKISLNIGDLYTGEVGILSSVRSMDKNGFATFRGLKVIAKCFKLLNIDAILTFVFEDNQKVIQMLKKQRKLFTINEIGRFYTYIIPIRSLKKNSMALKDLTVAWATKEDTAEIISFYQHTTHSIINCPYLSEETLDNTLLESFGIENFVTLRKENKIVCMMGICNQLEYRSWMVTKYNKLTRLFRVLINLFSTFTHGIYLPPINQDFKNLNLVFITCKKTNIDYFSILLSEISKEPRINGIADNLTICLHEKNPLRLVLNNFKSLPLVSKCFMLFSGSTSNRLQNIVKDMPPNSYPQIEACIL